MSTPVIATGPAAPPTPPSAYRAFTMSRWGAVVHAVVGGLAGAVLTVVLFIAFLGFALGGMAGMLVVLPFVPMLVFWALDACLFKGKGSLPRGVIAGLISIVGIIFVLMLSGDSGDDTSKLLILGPLVGIVAVGLTRLSNLFPSRTAKTEEVPPAAGV